MAKIVKDKTRIKNQQAFDHAELLFMSGVQQKDICTRVGVSGVTLTSWVESFGWKEKRAAKTVTRQELTNRLLKRIDELLEPGTDKEGDKDKEKGIEDKLSKLAKLVSQLDKEASVVDFIECFMQFSAWMSRRQADDKTITAEVMKIVNRMQDTFINEKLSMK